MDRESQEQNWLSQNTPGNSAVNSLHVCVNLCVRVN